MLVKDFLFHNMCQVRNGFLLKSRVSEIRLKRIRVNQGVGVISTNETTSHVIYNPAYTYKFQLKTTINFLHPVLGLRVF